MLRELARQEASAPAGERIVAHAVHPGGVRGRLLRFAPLPSRLVRAFEDRVYWDETTAALSVLGPLLRPDAARDARAPAYFVPIARERNASSQAADVELARRLWEWSAELIGAVAEAAAAASARPSSFAVRMSE